MSRLDEEAVPAAAPGNLCPLPGCTSRRGGTALMCRAHWSAIPEDLRERLKFARQESIDEWEAALYAAAQELGEV